MKTYKVQITETLQLTVEIPAANFSDAEGKVREAWENGDYILDDEAFKGVKIEAIRD